MDLSFFHSSTRLFRKLFDLYLIDSYEYSLNIVTKYLAAKLEKPTLVNVNTISAT